MKARWVLVTLMSIALCPAAARADGAPPGLKGPTYFVDVRLKNGDKDLGEKKIKWDPGASGTVFSRADAQGLGLLDANGDPVSSLTNPNGTVKGTNANGQSVDTDAVSIQLSVSVTGKDAQGKDNGATVTAKDTKPVCYPIKSSGDVKSLLGTNVIAEIPQETRTKDGGISYSAAPAPNPAMTIPLHAPGLINLYNSTTGQPVQDPLLANSLLTIDGTQFRGPTGITTAGLLYDPGSPYTIISQGLASLLGLTPVGTFDMAGEDPDTLSTLSFEGFLSNSNTDPFNIVNLSSISLPTQSGGFLDFTDVLALVNPNASVSANLFGSNVFANANMNAYDDYASGTVQLEAVPEPASALLLAAGMLGLAGRGARRLCKKFFYAIDAGPRSASPHPA